MSASNSLSDNNSGSDLNLASQYALRVALQTMKERCISLQQRLISVEEENLVLRSRCGMGQHVNSGDLGTASSELESVRTQVEELKRQKFQLTEHITMVATENRQLWSRLSQLAKDNKNKQSSSISTADSSTTTGQNLIRSKTFTQHSPNPNIRQKYMPAGVEDKSLDDMSLEEVSLKVLNNFNDSKTEVDHNKCDDSDSNRLDFGYLNDDTPDGDVGYEVRKCIDGMVDIKKELLKHQNYLKKAVNTLTDKKLVASDCASCKETKRPDMIDKSLETDLVSLDESCKNVKTTNSTDLPSSKIKNEEYYYPGNGHIDILEQKRLADELDKMCPLCGRTYNSNVTFDEFVEHVEMHFVAENDFDLNVERNFEFISHTVGNF